MGVIVLGYRIPRSHVTLATDKIFRAVSTDSRSDEFWEFHIRFMMKRKPLCLHRYAYIVSFYIHL
jgi:hypothetical protein